MCPGVAQNDRCEYYDLFSGKTDSEVRRIGRLSVVNAARNMLEFFLDEQQFTSYKKVFKV